MTLHEAIEYILKESKQPMTAKEIASEINQKELYRRGDGNPVPSSQIHARVKNYTTLFRKSDGMIHLINPSRNIIEGEKEKTNKRNILSWHMGMLLFHQGLFFKYGFSDIRSMLLTTEITMLTLIAEENYITSNIPMKISNSTELINLFNKISTSKEYSDLFYTIAKNRNILEDYEVLGYINTLADQLKDENRDEIFLKILSFLTFSAEQKGKTSLGEYTTPEFINELMVSLVKPKNGDLVFDPAAGQALGLLESFKYNQSVFLHGCEKNEEIASIGRLTLFLNSVNKFNIRTSDSLRDPLDINLADVIISDPPFGGNEHFNDNVSFEKICTDHSTSTLLFEHSLSKLDKDHGRMCMAVPAGFLFRKSVQALRKHIVDNDILEAVIQLPSGSYYPQTNIETALVFVNNNKSPKKAGKVLFINEGGEDNTPNRRKLSKPDLQYFNKYVENVKTIYQQEGFNIFSELKYRNEKCEKIASNEYELIPRRYTSEIEAIIKQTDSSENLQELGELIEKSKKRNIVPSLENEFKYVSIKDLADKDNPFYLNYDQLGFTKLDGRLYEIYNGPRLLISRIGNILKPTLSSNTDLSIAVIKNISVFRINTDIINEEYLITQLNSEFVKKQAELAFRGSTISSISIKNLLKLKIPVPSFSEQHNRLSLYKEQLANKNKLIRFINEIQLVNSPNEIKQEIERFVKMEFPDSEFIEFKKEYEYDKFPFSEKEITATQYIKQSRDKRYSYLLLLDNTKRINGVLTIQTEQVIPFDDYSIINAYANFITQTSSKYIQQNTNKLLNQFSHTTKNILGDINKIIKDFITTDNKELIAVLESSYIKDDEMIQFLISEDGRTKDDFIAINRLKEAANIVRKHIDFFKRRHEYYTQAINSEFEEVKLSVFINRIVGKNDNRNIEVTNSTNPNVFIFIKSAPAELAFTDILDNALKYSVDGRVNLKISSKEHFIEFRIQNKSEVTISKENYSVLGEEDIKQDDGSYSTGLKNAFQTINEDNNIVLGKYEKYAKEGIFEIVIKLKKK